MFEGALIKSSQIISKMLDNFIKDIGYQSILLDASDMQTFLSDKVQTIKFMIIPQGLIKPYLELIHKTNPRMMFLILKENGSSLKVKDALRYRIFGYIQNPIYLGELELMLQRLKEYLHLESLKRDTLKR
jgi:DNA-binding NtrC family response regulator